MVRSTAARKVPWWAIVLGQGVKAKVTMWIARVPESEAFTIMQAIPGGE